MNYILSPLLHVWNAHVNDAVFAARHLCSYTHPDLAEVPEAPQEYRNLKELKAALSQHLHRVFCNVCLEGRQVSNLSIKAYADKHHI